MARRESPRWGSPWPLPRRALPGPRHGGALSLSAGVLQKAGLIRYSRGHVEIVDRLGLEDSACECYQVIRDELAKVDAFGHALARQ